MGTDKGLLQLKTSSWAGSAIDKLTSLGLRVKLSVNQEQFAVYSSKFADSEVVLDNQSLAIRGPLQGIISAHITDREEDIFVLACDMPLMAISILKELYLSGEDNPAAEAIVYTNEGEPEPLCGIYRATALNKVLVLYHSSQLFKHSMKFMLEHVNAVTIPLRPDQQPYFRNFTAHADLNGL